jgi:steroid 5-alpha reductase family enzyme
MEGSFGYALASASLAVFVVTVALYVIALVRRDNTVLDIGRGPAMLLIALAVLWSRDRIDMRQLLVTALVAVWGMRLAAHLFMRSWGTPEDFRHHAARRDGGPHFWFTSFFRIFLPRAVSLLVVALPVIYINAFSRAPLNWLDGLGIALWLTGFIWESVADHQLAVFRQRSAGVLQSGLWRYSRHPNYFGEMLLWWGIWCMALSVSGGWVTVGGPLAVMFILLMHTGIPALELRQRRSQQFRTHARRTPLLLPNFSRK